MGKKIHPPVSDCIAVFRDKWEPTSQMKKTNTQWACGVWRVQRQGNVKGAKIISSSFAQVSP